tara:strand:+ start:973 stop:1140 length:168 start_codon:yes stop_codon:yes gene_type:complete
MIPTSAGSKRSNNAASVNRVLGANKVIAPSPVIIKKMNVAPSPIVQKTFLKRGQA